MSTALLVRQLTVSALLVQPTKTIQKKVKKAKDPNAPKRPKSAYVEYVRNQT